MSAVHDVWTALGRVYTTSGADGQPGRGEQRTHLHRARSAHRADAVDERRGDTLQVFQLAAVRILSAPERVPWPAARHACSASRRRRRWRGAGRTSGRRLPAGARSKCRYST